MKFLLPLLALLPAALGNSEIEHRRDQQLESLWDIQYHGLAYDVDSGLFTVTFEHGAAAGGAALEIYTATASPTGSAVETCKTNGGAIDTTAGFLQQQAFSPFAQSGPDQSTFVFALDPSVDSNGNVYIPDAGDPSLGATVKFCLLFGLTDSATSNQPGQIITFLEVGITIVVDLQGEFTVASFNTLAMNPTADGENVDYEIDAYGCPGQGQLGPPYNQLDAIPICICPKFTSGTDANGNPLSAANPAGVTTVASVELLQFAAISGPAAAGSGTGQTVISGGDDQTAAIATVCNPQGGNPQTVGAPVYCCKVDVLLKSDFYPDNDDPAGKSEVEASGTAVLQFGTRRKLVHIRSRDLETEEGQGSFQAEFELAAETVDTLIG
ncbi:expressed unknown protein [Seminavis robusta]|uniref:Uncharacterized protein n=1 Tax=Seminavis robusta TaxID=568900 RepID=A0A9N8HGZ5_9STRA|nr:expressed unknown protein [Seminavis robusta]|eukprot:Sro510_g157330.1 n/a (382) ;mRNA; f:53601-55091